MQSGIHHLHKRKRVHAKLEQFPHEDPRIRFLDRLLLALAIIGPLVSIPQIWKIFHGKNPSGVSALSFGLFAVMNIPWIIYGIVHKEKPIVVAYSLWLVSNTLVVIGTLMYS